MKREEEEKKQSERELERGFFEKRTRVTMESRCHETLVMDRVLISHARIDGGTGQGFRFPFLLFLFCFHDTFIYIQTLGISSTCPRRKRGWRGKRYVWAFCEQRARDGKVDGGDNGGSSPPNDNHFASRREERANFETISGSKVGDSVAKYRCAQVSFRFCQQERAIVPSLV